MKRFIVGGLLALAFIPVGASTVSAAANKVNICHDGDAGWELIIVAAPAAKAHLRHGDAAPGATVPGTNGDTFADDCSIIPASPFKQLCDSVGGQTEFGSNVFACSLATHVPLPPTFGFDLSAACDAEATLGNITLVGVGYSTSNGLLRFFRCLF